jgi:hypothetical protein
VGKNQDPDPDFLTILDPRSSSATLNIILKIFFRVKRQMEEELKTEGLHRGGTGKPAKTGVLAQQKCCSWLRTGTAAELELPILTAAKYRPNLGGASDHERLLVIYQTFFLFLFPDPTFQ